MRIYLAGPMRGRENHNFPAFMKMASKLRAMGHDVFNPAEKGCEKDFAANPDAINTLAFRRKVFGLDWGWIAANADVIAALPEWEQSRGAVSEKACADAIGIPVIYLGQSGWEKALQTITPETAMEVSQGQAEGRLVDKVVSFLPTDSAARKTYPMASGVLDYFPDALAAVSNVSYVGNQQHNPGEPLHWERAKSTDHDDTIIRHFQERGTLDTDGQRHSAKLAWRALALLQQELERAHGLPLPRGATVNGKRAA